MVTRSLLTGIAVLTLSVPAAVPATAPAAVPTAVPTLPAGRRDGSPTADSLPPITYVAHRGGALEVPENSMSGLTTAYERAAAQVLDFDTRMLRDGTLVVMHDATLDRTTYSTGPVKSLTAAQWRTIRLRPGSRLPGLWLPETPPTVGEALDRFGGRRVLMVEAKDPDSLPHLSAMIHARGLTRSVFVNTNHLRVARQAHRMGLLTQLWRSALQLRKDRPRTWRGFVDLLDVDYQARKKDLRRAVASGIRRVWAHTVNTPEARDRMLRLGCGGIITDAPTLLTRTAR
ncbi:glycerophosphodiester phosphodiesterase [Streptomyces sp. ME19-01-6]|uniref:glycerophosphodiester phosphodiesterase n=1 Tax=Streptomyces sp. ME19-01-6 TaxID=3028686 RepID=UPI0029A14C58|nr:glycerophosphodiester phosphodiesterase family protein [Streptomyces sp. ME19-01-6]MDX3231307.1 glycerophosphodiester phosphodiesterase family protein [Streptomyces sp. ME19-01-6]